MAKTTNIPKGPLLGIVPSKPDERDHLYVPKTRFEDLASAWSLEHMLQDREDQLQVGSCVTHGITTAFETVGKQNGFTWDWSRYALYTMTMSAEGRFGQGGGLYTRDAFQVARHYGVVSETMVPYINSEPTEDMPESVYQAALQNRLGEYQLVHPPMDDGINRDALSTVNKMKAAIMEGMPVVFGLQVSDDIRHMTGPWQNHNYTKISPSNPTIGGHLMVAYGYDDATQRFKCRNWWGDGWGDDGWGGFNYYQLTTSPFFEAYVVRDFNGMGVNEAPGFKFIEQNNYRASCRLTVPDNLVGTTTNIWIGAVQDGGPNHGSMYMRLPRVITDTTTGAYRQLTKWDVSGNNTDTSGNTDVWGVAQEPLLPTVSGYVLEKNQTIKIFEWQWMPNLSGRNIYMAYGDELTVQNIQHVMKVR